MNILRTPDERFNHLADYPFEPHYLEVNGLRIHYLDEGEGERIALLMHGEPSWSYLYRTMIPTLVQNGIRVVAPDLVGFGRSDKPAAMEDYTYQRHVDWMERVVLDLDLKNITLFCQDWGGLIGLRLAVKHSDRFSRIMAANTFLPTGDEKPSEAFQQWQNFSQQVKRFPVGMTIQRGCVSNLSQEVLTAYNAPFPNESYKTGARVFPALVPTSPDDPASDANRHAWQQLKSWQKPFITAFSDSDPITKGGDLLFRRYVPGAKGQKHFTIKDAGHFLQEDKGEELAQILADFMHG